MKTVKKTSIFPARKKKVFDKLLKLRTLSIYKKGFKKFEPEQLVAIGKQAGFDNIQVKDIAKGKSFVVIYSKN